MDVISLRITLKRLRKQKQREVIKKVYRKVRTSFHSLHVRETECESSSDKSLLILHLRSLGIQVQLSLLMFDKVNRNGLRYEYLWYSKIIKNNTNEGKIEDCHLLCWGVWLNYSSYLVTCFTVTVYHLQMQMRYLG